MIIHNIAPTRSNLLRLKDSLRFAKEGYAILDKKREVLTVELMKRVGQVEMLQKKTDLLLAQAYQALETARLTMGREKMEWAAVSVKGSIEVKILNRGMMGVPLPEIEAYGVNPDLTYSMGGTSVALDLTREAFAKVLDEVPELTMLQVSVSRLARELKKTQRRVNALERIFIPNYQDTIHFIEENLEEQDREEIFRLQWLKKKKEETAPE
ncbi:MAG: V-type ATP synthase subunit D [Anaerolineaceae bacterium]|nr:V-type ATP synthase subunit D [Anaerolineaceae bacterium]